MKVSIYYILLLCILAYSCKKREQLVETPTVEKKVPKDSITQEKYWYSKLISSYVNSWYEFKDKEITATVTYKPDSTIINDFDAIKVTYSNLLQEKYSYSECKIVGMGTTPVNLKKMPDTLTIFEPYRYAFPVGASHTWIKVK